MTSPRYNQQRSRFQQCLRIAGFTVPALALLLMFALWHYRTPLLNNIAKPRLEQFLSTNLAALVTIEQLALDRGQLRMRGLTVDHADLYYVTVPALILDFNLGNLWRGRLDSLRVEQPEVYFNPTFLPDNNNSTPFRLRKPPISIDLLTVTGGRFDLVLTDQVVAVRAIEFDLHHAPSRSFRLAVTVQGETPLKLSTSGQWQWETDPQLQVQLNEVNIDGHSLLTTPLTLRPAVEGLAAGGELVLAHVDRAQLDPWLALAGMQQLLAPDVDFSVQNLRLGVEIRGGQVQGQLAAAALQLTKGDVRFQANNLRLSGAGDRHQWQAVGEAQLAEGSPVSFAVQGTDGHVVATGQGTFRDLARIPKVVGQDQALPVSGGLEWTARTSWLNQVLELSGDFHSLWPQPSAGVGAADRSPFRGNFQVQGAIDALSGNLKLDLRGAPLLTVEGNSGQLVAQLHRTPVGSLAQILSPSRWPHLVEKKGWLAGQIQLNPTADAVQGHFNLIAEGLHAAGFDVATSHISSSFHWQQEQLAVADLNIQTTITGHGLSIPVATLQGAARWHAPSLQMNIAALTIENLEYLSADDMSALAGGSLNLAGTVAWDEAQQQSHARLQGSAQMQEALIHSFYGDLSQLPIDFDLQAAWDATLASLQVNDISLFIPAIGQFKGQLKRHSDTLEFGGELLLPHLETGFNLQLRPLLATLFPGLEQLELNGTLAADSTGVWRPDGWNVSGALHPDTLGLKYRAANISMLDLAGEIPFVFSSGGKTSGVARNGFVTFSQLQAGPVSSAANDLTLTAMTNRLTFIDPWKLNLAGGNILIENLSIGHDSSDLSVSGRTRINHIDLQELTQELELTLLRGSLTADLGEFEYVGGMLQSEGEARIDVFAGTIQIRNLRARDIFSSYRSIEGDIDFHGIDLEQLTRTFAFGEINGIMDGYIHDLRLFGKIPSAFVAEFTTRDQGQRNISVKALNNLTVISQGGLSAALSRGVYRFIDFYRYRNIGLRCVLRNDVFVLKGTARADSDLHLVDGGLLPPRIDILAPGTGVSFREMLRRLERIDRTTTR
ncbi:hypothetical protein [Pelovirga terrestris]|uniref:AsmA-like C-terminal domain-containing protein n=1 Tax=Pelovirga terrestris TaxID=2771352 RepID=A0A8J6QMS1_9BACT|nr:hypothetical protein [Pelovirga terrestris]MBD1401554.1 hypothetical protein [Pelovirga terrestris]